MLPVEASVFIQNGFSKSGYATIGDEVRASLSVSKACCSASPQDHSLSFEVRFVNGSATFE